MAKIDYKLVVAQTRQLTLLYVEDDDTLREVTADIFRKFFAHVDVAANGQEGLDQYKRYHKNTHDYYDVVITDLMMPMMDGIEMASQIRHILWNQIIVMISAHSEQEHFIKLLEMGVDGFILKPMDHEKLLEALYKAGQKAQDRRMGMAYCAGNEALIAELERVNAGIKALPQNDNTAKVQVQMPHIETRALPSDEQQLLRQSFTRKTSAVDYVNDIGGDVLDEIRDLASLDDEWKDNLCAIELEPTVENIEAFVDNVLTHYTHAIDNLVEFTALGYALAALGITMKQNAQKLTQDPDALKKMVMLMEHLGHDLATWREHIFELQDTDDIHYLDSSFFSSCIQVEGIITNQQIEADGNDLELF